MKRIIMNVAVIVLLAVNVVNIVQKGINILNTMAIVVCLICLALNFVDRTKDEE